MTNLALRGLMILMLPLAATADDRVFRGAESIRIGNHYADAVHVDFGDEQYPSQVMDMLAAMPRIQTLVVGGPRYDDLHLPRLASFKTLRVLVLDSVDISDRAIADLRMNRPDLIVILSQRWAIEAIGDIHPEVGVTTRLNDSHPEIRQRLGDQYFNEATGVSFRRLPDDETGPFDRILNEQLAPIRMLPTLTRLDLSWTRLNDGGMFYLKRLTKLEHLRIPLDEVSADGLIHLRGMIHLKEFGGKIDDQGIRHLAGLKNLEFLSIHENSSLTDAGLESICRLSSLNDLRLLSRHINGSGLKHLAELTSLTDLTLGSGVSDLSHLPRVRSLRRLALSSADIGDTELLSLAKCTGLESLALDKTIIGDRGVIHLKGLSNLRSLSLNETRVGDAGLAALQELGELRYLQLDRTRVSNAGLAVLQKFPALEHLSLHGIPLDAEGIQNLSQLKNLKALAVTYRHESFPDIPSRVAANRELKERIRSALPNCNVQ